ncbi:Crp/Fnr family transcriptional regulator [Maribacter sp. 2307ULW6-5]|uniref:Crp/Fnr family transcriptional regulator n=1 Tax=Maribacter sp. 2307ULW6-5 TaxID=3386275 RepID=UPI0039BCCB1A
MLGPFLGMSALTEAQKALLLQRSEHISLSKGSQVFLEKQTLQSIFLIHSGACKFHFSDEGEDEQITRFLGKGDLMGKRSVTLGGGTRVTATTMEPTELCRIDKKSFLQLLRTDAHFCQGFLKWVLRDMNEDEEGRMWSHPKKSIKKRLAGLLLFLAKKFGTDVTGKLLVRIKRDEMASFLGTSQEYVISLLRKFNQLNYIQLKKRNIYISSLSDLKKLAF